MLTLVVDISKLINDAGRSLMGSIQENWYRIPFHKPCDRQADPPNRFYRALKKSSNRGATWRLIGSQIVFSTINATAWFDTPYNLDAWDGYMANRNRTLKVLYENNIGNNIVMAGDTHENWVADLVWLNDTTGHGAYDRETGAGGIGVEFAGTAVSSTGSCRNSNRTACNAQSAELVRDNPELQWQEAWYRGYYELKISKEKVVARYFGTPSLETRNGYEVSLANFTVENGQNRLARPVAGGSVDSGALQRGQPALTNLTYDTNTGEWFVHDFGRVNLPRVDDE
jgi:alkaline phosphatase D